MNKKNLRGYIVMAIAFVVFSVIAFAVPFAKTGAFFIAYIAGVVAIGFQAYVLKVAFDGDNDVKSKFYGFPIAKIGIIYAVVQIVLSLVEMGLSFILPFWLVLVIDILPIAIAAVGCIAADAMREEIVRQDVEIKKDVSNMRKLQSKSSSLVGMCEDKELKNIVQNMADEFKYSDPVSSDETEELEKNLETQLSDLQSAIIDGDAESAKILCKKIVADLKERNRICKLGK